MPRSHLPTPASPKPCSVPSWRSQGSPRAVVRALGQQHCSARQHDKVSGKSSKPGAAPSLPPAYSLHTSLLSTYCVQGSAASHPQRCWPALTTAHPCGENIWFHLHHHHHHPQEGKGQICFAVCPSLLQLHFPPETSACQRVSVRESKASSVYTFPSGGNNREAKPRP